MSTLIIAIECKVHGEVTTEFGICPHCNPENNFQKVLKKQ